MTGPTASVAAAPAATVAPIPASVPQPMPLFPQAARPPAPPPFSAGPVLVPAPASVPAAPSIPVLLQSLGLEGSASLVRAPVERHPGLWAKSAASTSRFLNSLLGPSVDITRATEAAYSLAGVPVDTEDLDLVSLQSLITDQVGTLFQRLHPSSGVGMPIQELRSTGPALTLRYTVFWHLLRSVVDA